MYVFVVGLGLGVWKIRNDQRQMFLDVIGDILHVCPPLLSFPPSGFKPLCCFEPILVQGLLLQDQEVGESDE